MYGIFPHIYHQNQANVSTVDITYMDLWEIYNWIRSLVFFRNLWSWPWKQATLTLINTHGILMNVSFSRCKWVKQVCFCETKPWQHKIITEFMAFEHRFVFHSFVCDLFLGGTKTYTLGQRTWNLNMEVWKMYLLSKRMIFRLHVSLRGCRWVLVVSFRGVPQLNLRRASTTKTQNSYPPWNKQQTLLKMDVLSIRSFPIGFRPIFRCLCC